MNVRGIKGNTIMSMLENLKKLESEGKVGGSDYFKPQEGNNIIRVLTEGIYNVNKFGNSRFVMFVIDRKDKLKSPAPRKLTTRSSQAQIGLNLSQMKSLPLGKKVPSPITSKASINPKRNPPRAKSSTPMRTLPLLPVVQHRTSSNRWTSSNTPPKNS